MLLQGSSLLPCFSQPMTSFHVRFKGLLFKLHLDRLAKAGLPLSSKESPESVFGQPINVAHE
jgi:hypothetical protein